MAASPHPTLGQTIRARRQELGMTQEDLAQRIGDSVGQNYISQLERDRVKLPRSERLRLIAAVLGLPAGVLLERSGWSSASITIESNASARAAVSKEDARQELTDEDDPTLDLVMSGARELTPAGRRILLAQIEEIRAMQRQAQEDLRREAERDLRRDRERRELEGIDVPPD